jgi:REP element-mobilizing transposase RayT
MTDPIFYQRRLPHYQPPEATYFITFRLANSLPQSVIARLKSEFRLEWNQLVQKPVKNRRDAVYDLKKRYLINFDQLLDRSEYGPHWLQKEEIASIVKESIHHRDENTFHLLAYTIMPNHVHLVFDLRDMALTAQHGASAYRATAIMENLKWYSALRCNRALNLSGQFWQHESYDHVVRRDGELTKIIHYVLSNSVKAHLTDDWQKWPWSYVKQDLYGIS